MFRTIFMSTMAFSPRIVLSTSSRERCVANLKQLPSLIDESAKCTKFAAVLVPLCVVGEEVCILYTVRSMFLKTHSGQISFPGGMLDGDETPLQGALRETEEEIGVRSMDVDVWAVMPPVQGRNKEVHITPVVGEIKNFRLDKLIPNIQEVDEIFTVPLSGLANPENHAHLMFNSIKLPIYMYGKHYIWGITGLMTQMFLTSLLPEDVYKEDFQRKKLTLEELMYSNSNAKL